MQRITQRLPDAAMISVGHRPELEAFHNRRLVLARRKDGARLVSDEVLTPETFASASRVLSCIFRKRPAVSGRRGELRSCASSIMPLSQSKFTSKA